MVKIFLSWSYENSLRIAKAFVEWLPNVVQDVEIFFSPDIEKGIRSLDEIATQLEETNFGIAFLTPENLESTWIHFEAGGLVKLRDKGRLAAVLCFGLKHADIKPPLSQFQNVLPAKDDLFKLVAAINGHSEKPIPGERLKIIFEKWWPDLEPVFQPPVAEAAKAQPAARTVEDKVDEVLALTRNLSQRPAFDAGSAARQFVERHSSKHVLEEVLGQMEQTVYFPPTVSSTDIARIADAVYERYGDRIESLTTSRMGEGHAIGFFLKREYDQSARDDVKIFTYEFGSKLAKSNMDASDKKGTEPGQSEGSE